MESDDKFERIGGTATGGGTFWGLGKLLTKAKDFDDLLELAAIGDHRKVDMLVKDIYGEKDNYQTLGRVMYLVTKNSIQNIYNSVIRHGQLTSKNVHLYQDSFPILSQILLFFSLHILRSCSPELRQFLQFQKGKELNLAHNGM